MHYSLTEPPPIVYALCCTSRSGSTYLCELLASTGTLGQPDEYLNTASMALWRRRMQLPGDASLLQYVDRLLAEYTAADVFGVKTVPEALQRLETHVAPTHFLWLRRRDTLRQAISLYRASHSGVWQRGEEASPLEPVPFDRGAIHQVRGWIDSTNAFWQERFRTEPWPTLALWYEEICEHPQAAVEQIAEFLERPLPEGLLVNASTCLMRDALTEEWVRRLAA